MRHLSALSVQVTFDGPVVDLSSVPGASVVEVTGSVVRCQVLGPIEPLLKVLAEAGVKELLSQEASLEQLFLAHYGPGRAGRGGDGGRGPDPGRGRDRQNGPAGTRQARGTSPGRE